MIADITTVMWKEWRSMFRAPGTRSRTALTLLVPLMLAIYLPWQSAEDWTTGPLALIASIVVPVLLVGVTIPDSFAGERERHTLATLLASRLPNNAILFGKLIPSVVLGWGLSVLVLIIGLVTTNLVNSEGELFLYTPIVLTSALTLSLLMSTLVAATGVLISLRIGTVQEASQMLVFSFMIPPTVAGPLLLIFSGGRLKDKLNGLDTTQLFLIVATILALATAALIAAAIARFQRAKLILD